MNKMIFIKFKLFCNETNTGDSVHILGSINELGKWDLRQSIELFTNFCDYPIWESKEIKIENNEEKDIIEFEYKYLIKSSENCTKWEDYNGNRHLEIDIKSSPKHSVYIINGEYFNDLSKKSFVVIQTREQIKEEQLKTLETEENLDTSFRSLKSNEVKSDSSPKSKISLNKDFNLDKYLDELIMLIQDLKEDSNNAKEKLNHLFDSLKGSKNFDKELLILIFIHFLKTGQFKYLDSLPEYSEHHYHFDPILTRAICTYLASNINEENSLLIRSLLRYIPSCSDNKGLDVSHKDFI